MVFESCLKRAFAPASSCKVTSGTRSTGYAHVARSDIVAVAIGHVGGGGSFGYADPERRLGIGFTKNYFTYATGGAVNAGRPPRAASNVVTEAVFDALGLQR